MYSRNLDPRRSPQVLPHHYGGSAFRADGTPTPIPVQRDPEAHFAAPPREETAHTSEEQRLSIEDPPHGSDEQSAEAFSPMDASDFYEEKTTSEAPGNSSDGNAPFLSRLMGGLLPGLRDDDLLLLLLILLLSREEGNEDALLLLALLLFGK